MKILFLSPYLPFPPDFGGARRTYHLIAGLAKQGHDLTILAFGSPRVDAVAVAGMSSLARVELIEDRLAHHPGATQFGKDHSALATKRRLQLRSLLSPHPYQYYAYYSPLLQTRLSELLRASNFDIVQVEFSQMSYYRFDQAPAHTRFILDLHNIEYEVLGRTALTEKGLARRIYNLSEFTKFRFAERQGWRKFDACLTTSSRDGAIVKRACPEQFVEVIPNGVDLTHFQPSPLPTQPAKISFMGIMRYYPNVDGVIYFSQEIFPLVRHAEPEATFHIVGGQPTEAIQSLASPTNGTFVTGYVTDIQAYVADSSIFVVPLRIGGGTRLKIMDALAMGRPIVSTSLGCEGIAVTPEKDILLGDTPEEFAHQVIRLLRDPALQERLSIAGRRLVEKRYNWPQIARSLADVYGDLHKKNAQSKKIYA